MAAAGPPGRDAELRPQREPQVVSTGAAHLMVDPGAITEDPATGSAAGPLLVYLRERDGADEQGVEQASRWAARAGSSAAGPTFDRVSGDVVVVADGHVLLGDG
jgi:predicted PhzF superfamily epimerase YddE/YHI9